MSSSRYSSSAPPGCKVYVGGLNKETSRDEIERAFDYYGKIKNVFVARNPPGFAFVEFDDARDAEDAVRALDGRYVLLKIRNSHVL
jgi:arginine/serine-rich splicing factor 7